MRIVIEATSACRAVRTGISRYTIRLVDAMAVLAAEQDDALRLGFRLSRWKQRQHCYRPPGLDVVWIAGRAWPLWPNADVVHASDSRVPPWRGVARVATVFDVAVLLYPDFASARFRARKAAEWRRLKATAHRVLAISEATRTDFLARFDFPPECVDVVFPGIDAQFRPVPAPERQPVLERLGVPDPYLLYVGELSRRKNLDGLLEGYARSRLRDEMPLVLAGPPSYGMEAIAGRLRALNLTERVRLLGFVADADLPALYSGAAAFVFPTHYEGFGLPALEAMACGTPVLGGNRGSVPEVTGGHAVLADPDDAASIAQGMEAAVNLPHEARQAAQRHAAGFTWEACARGTRAVYERALAQR